MEQYNSDFLSKLSKHFDLNESEMWNYLNLLNDHPGYMVTILPNSNWIFRFGLLNGNK